MGLRFVVQLERVLRFRVQLVNGFKGCGPSCKGWEVRFIYFRRAEVLNLL
jgi:hypothetical protein